MTINRGFLQDETRSIDDRVMYLLDEMTLEEKLAQIVAIWVTDLLDSNQQFVESQAEDRIGSGIGQITRVAASSHLGPQESARLANQIQHFLFEHTRLGIPAVVHEESCAGFMARGATSFPQAIGLASTWDPNSIKAMTEAIRQQMRAVGAHQGLAPVLDVVRDPRWGRVEETYGEDPFLISSLGLAYVRGIQSDDLRQGVAATGKHFAAHGLPEGGMNWAPVHVGDREFREIFLTPFKAVIQEGEIASMMNAYHELDGIPCGSSRELMIDILRDEFGFEGVVVADYFTLRNLVDYHHVARDKTDAARMGLEAGIDIELPFPDCYGDPLRQAIDEGTIPIELVDVSVKRVLQLKFQLGLFDQPYVDEGKVVDVFDTAQQRDLSRHIARQSLVLLTNDGLLPLSKTLGSIAVVGPHADSARLMQGDYHYPAHLDHIFERASSPNAPAPAPTPQQREVQPIDWNERLPPTVTLLEGIKTAVSATTKVAYAQGCEVNHGDTSGFDEAVALAASADVVIVALGDKSGLALGRTVGESIDSAELVLPGVQQQLLEAICATGTPVVLVLITGRPYALGWAADHTQAMIQAWLPAQEGGAALADVLFGDVAPGGKLPLTFPRSVGQIPVYYNHKPSGGRSNWQRDYRDMSADPLFPFGHGLSYTDFTYSDLALSVTCIGADESLQLSLKVKNSGSRAGDEVVQLYVADPVASVTRPVKMLKGFKRVTLQPGEAKTLHFELDARHLAFYDRHMDFVVEPGQIDVMVGSSSQDIRLNASFEITGESTIVDQVFVTPVSVE